MVSDQDFPEEYTDGSVLFCGQRFSVDPRALIPRFETEELVKYCVKLLGEHPEIQHIVDVGTGSGIIPISLAKKAARTLQVVATDMSPDALALAEENATKLGRDITFLQGDLLLPVQSYFSDGIPESLLITANLPYVREVEINSGLMHEPRMAFLGGVQTGFELYERFFDQLFAWKNRPKICYVVIEFGMWQRDIAETLFQQYGFQYSFFPDLRGIERFSHIMFDFDSR